MNLTQSALILGGTFNLKYSGPDNEFEIDFVVNGKIWEGYVILNLTPARRQLTSYATCLLKIGGGGVSLDGQISFRNVLEERVTSEDIRMIRKSS
jgi:hypothetical protein